ncbi:hypothetical protein AB4305_01060 [Nocardia sp. 2YAB30]|uniref:hypothetical protein n=1 Tax=unclassified Nocardia TaxID=2637762 RepID=UPI003F969540
MTSPVFETATPNSLVYLDRLAATDLGRFYKGRMLNELDVRLARRWWISAAAPAPISAHLPKLSPPQEQ